MDNMQWFEDIPVIGKMKDDERSQALSEIDELEPSAAAFQTDETEKRDAYFFNIFSTKAWMHTAHSFGYLGPSDPTKELLPISHAGNIEADSTLKNSRIKITLDRLRIADYPGYGDHLILFDFYAQNQLSDSVEHLHFNNTYKVREGEHAPIVGYPIFVGLNVGSEGVAFRCYTVNVKNTSDEKFLAFLDSDIFKSGLQLGIQLQPAIGPLSNMVKGITESIAKRNRNVPVQDFYLGLDFSKISTRARLREGSYIAVQIPESFLVSWDWDEWVFNPSNGHIVNKNLPDQLIPYNYVCFSISRLY